MSFANNLVELRKYHDFSQEELAEMIGVSRQTLSKYETGESLPEKKMSRAKRTLLGRIDPETGEIIPTDGRNRKKKEEKPAASPSPEDYKEMYEKLLKKYEAQEQIIKSLQDKISKMESKEQQ